MKTKLMPKLIATAACLLFCISPMTAQETITVTVAYSEGGKMLINDEEVKVKILPKGSVVKITTIPDNGVQTTAVSVQGGPITPWTIQGQFDHNFVNWMTDLNYVVVFGDYYYITTSYNEGGGVLIDDQYVPFDFIKKGDPVTFPIVPDEGYFIKSVTSNGTSVIDRLTEWWANDRAVTYTISSVTEHAQLEVNFTTTPYYQVVSSCNEGGKILINDQDISGEMIEEDETVTFTVTPNYGYIIREATFSGTSVIDQLAILPVPESPGAISYTYTSPAITERTKFEVIFEDARLDVITSCNEGGKILINDQDTSADKIKEGEAVIFTIIPNEEFFIKEVTFNGIPVIDQLSIWPVPGFPEAYTCTYTSPAIVEESELNVVFALISPISIDAVNISPIKVYTTSGVLVVEGATAGEPISIYSQTGTYIKTEQANEGRTEIPLPSGVYIIKVGEQAMKIAL